MEPVPRVKGMVHSFTEDEMVVLTDLNQWFRFQIPDARPPVGKRLFVVAAEDGKPEYELDGQSPASPEEVASLMYRYDHIATDRLAAAEEVTEERVRQFREQGFLVIDRILSDEEVAAAKEAVSDIIHGRITGPYVQMMKKEHDLRTPEERELAVRKLHRFVDHAPALHRACFHPGVQRTLEMLFGEKAQFLEDQAILKPPSKEAGAEKPWHQDMAYGNLSQTKMVCGVWIALDDAGLDNGCMHVIPGSHRDGPVPHYAIRDWQLCDARVDVAQDVACTLKPGGALFFHGLLHHGTPPNFSGKRRRALQFHYSPASSHKMTPEQFKLMFTNEMTDAEC